MCHPASILTAGHRRKAFGKHFPRAAFAVLLTALCVSTPVSARPEKVRNQCEFFFVSRRDASMRTEKSGTPHLYRMLNDRSAKLSEFQSEYNMYSRPELDRFEDSAKGHFRVHYDISGSNAPDLSDTDGNSVPDYVDSALVYLEYAWDSAVGLKYNTPLSDMGRGGTNAVDVYIYELSAQGYYGYTSPDNSYSGMGSSYMVLDNNFQESIYPTKGYDALKVTTAHEFFHVIHYSYYGGIDAVWWMEHTAVWLEDYVWDEINDYRHYVSGFLKKRTTPLDSDDSSFMYGAALFAFMLSQQHGPQILRTVWSEFRDRQSGRITLVSPLIPGSLAKALSDLGVWSYFTADRANPRDFFKDSAILEDTVTVEKTVHSIPATDSLSCRRYTFKYVEFAPPGGLTAADTLQISFSDRSGGIWNKTIILFNTPYDYEILEVSGASSLLTPDRSFQKAVLLFSNTASGAGDYRIAYSITPGGASDPAVASIALAQNTPNPFNRETVIQYTLSEPSHVRIRILNQLGQTVRVLVDEMRQQGSNQTVFDAKDLSSGVYFALLESGTVRLTRKMLFLK